MKHDRVKIRNTHPTLYWQIMIFALMSVAMAANFWFGPPATFNPYGISRDLIAVAFALYGAWQIIFLNIHYLLMVRIGLTFAFVLMAAWGLANTVQAFAGNASFQLPILYVAIGAAHFRWLTESPVNPMTQREQ